MIKVLQLLGGGDSIGGVEKMLLNYYSHMDRNLIKFDFCFYRKSTIGEIGSKDYDLLKTSQLYDLRLFDSRNVVIGYLLSIIKVRKIIKKGDYEIVHVNAGRPPLLLCGLISALLSGTKVIILHSHGSMAPNDKKSVKVKLYLALSSLLKTFFRRFSTHLAACSHVAGVYMFGKQVLKSSKYRLIHNAICIKPYLFNENVRIETRKQLGIDEGTIVFGHVGRFSSQKNHAFLLEVFLEIQRRINNCVLWLVGNGELKNDMKEVIRSFGLENNVRLLGERSDVEKLYQGMDALIFPSYWEGLSVTLVEAQASSLPVFTSTNISPEHKLTDRIHFIDLGMGAQFWADYILSNLNDYSSRMNEYDVITNNGYNIEVESKGLQSFYLQEATK